MKIKSLEEIVVTSFINEILLSQTNAHLIFLATCFGANIYNFTENTDKNIIGWSRVSDAIMVGYLVALLVNAQFQYLDDARANLNLLIDRYYQISEHPEQIIPLVWTKIQKINTCGWFGILLASSVIVHFKFTPSEVSVLDDLNEFLGWVLGIFGILFTISGVGIVGGVFFGLLVLEIVNIYSALRASENHHPDGGAWISFEFFAWPPIGSYVHGYAQSGSTVYNFLFIPDINSATLFYTVFEGMIHDWTWMSI
ncbi:hypothetical protein ES707_13464 [subsurface metagenome]